MREEIVDIATADGSMETFIFPERWCYHKPAAERHWERLIALHRRRPG